MRRNAAQSVTNLAISIGRRRSGLIEFTSNQGNPNPFIILSSSLHSSTQSTLPRKCRYGFDDIKDLADALTLFHQLLRIKPMPSLSIFNKLLNIIVKMEHYSEVIFLFKKLSLLGRPVNEFIMSTVINCYCHLKEVDLGFAVVATFLKRGFAPDIVTINCLIKGLFLEEKLDKAVELFKKLIREKLCKVDDFTIPIVLNGLCKSRNVGIAVQLLEILKKDAFELHVANFITGKTYRLLIGDKIGGETFAGELRGSLGSLDGCYLA